MKRGWQINSSVSSGQSSSDFDHGGLQGLADDDHTQYLLTNGNRDLTGDWSITSNDIIFSDNKGIKFGSGSDSYIYYNGVDFIVDTDQVGTGKLIVNGIDIHATGSQYNHFFGYSCGGSVTSGTFNTGIGYQVLENLTEGNNNVAVGYQALKANVLGSSSVAIGVQALLKATGSSNFAFGSWSFLDLVNGSNNFAIGISAGESLTSAYTVTLIGTRVVQNTTSLNRDVIIGYEAGKNISWTQYCVMIGYQAGIGSSGVGCVYIGYMSGGSASTNNTLYIENSNSQNPLIYGEFDNDLIRLNGVTTLTNTVHNMLDLRHQTSNTPAANYGVSFSYELEDNAGNVDTAGITECIWTDATNGSEDSDIIWKLMDGGAAAAERARLTSDGDFKITNDYYSGGNQGLSGTLTLDDGSNWRITLTFTGGILTGQTTGASSAATATWV